MIGCHKLTGKPPEGNTCLQTPGTCESCPLWEGGKMLMPQGLSNMRRIWLVENGAPGTERYMHWREAFKSKRLAESEMKRTAFSPSRGWRAVAYKREPLRRKVPRKRRNGKKSARRARRANNRRRRGSPQG